MAVVGSKFDAEPAQIEDGIDPAQHVIRWNTVFQAKLIEQTILCAAPPAHYPYDPVENHLCNGITAQVSSQLSSSTASAIIRPNVRPP